MMMHADDNNEDDVSGSLRWIWGADDNDIDNDGATVKSELEFVRARAAGAGPRLRRRDAAAFSREWYVLLCPRAPCTFLISSCPFCYVGWPHTRMHAPVRCVPLFLPIRSVCMLCFIRGILTMCAQRLAPSTLSVMC